METFLAYEFWGNSVESYTRFLVSLLLFLVAITIGKSIVIRKLKKISKKTKNQFDDFAVKIIDEINILFFLLLAFYFALQTLNVPEVVDRNLYYIFLILITILVIRFIQKLIAFGAEQYAKHLAKLDKSPMDKTLVKYLVRIFNTCLWIFGLLMIISNLGYNVSSLLAGIGIGGIAIALASQQILSNFFNSLFIIFDKPFKVGDTVSIDEHTGEVIDIGFRSTRVKTLRGEELILSNSDVMSSRVQNFKKMKKRRSVFTIGVTYDTPLKKLKKVPKLILDIIKKQEFADTEEDSSRVHFAEYADSSMNFEVVYHLVTKEYKVFSDTQQDINFAIAEAFEKEGIEMAFPTRTIYLKNE